MVPSTRGSPLHHALPSGGGRALLALAVVALASIAARESPGAEPRRLLFSDGVFRSCELLLSRVNGLDVRLDGKVEFLDWGRLDPAQAAVLRADRFEKASTVPAVRLRFDLARDCLASGLVEMGRRQVQNVAVERPLLTEVAGIWLQDFPRTEFSTALDAGVESLLAGNWDDVYVNLKKAAGAPAEAPESAAARRYLKVFILAGGRVPPSESGEKIDPAVASQIRVIQGRMTAAWGKAEDAERHFREERVSDMNRAFDAAEALMDKVALETSALQRALQEGPGRTQVADLQSRVVRDMLELHIRRGSCSIEMRIWTAADEAITKAEKLGPADERVKALRERLNVLYRKKQS